MSIEFGEEVPQRPDGCPSCGSSVTIYATSCWRCGSTFTAIESILTAASEDRDRDRAAIARIVEDDRENLDRLRTILKGVFGSIPVAGSLVSSLFEIAWGSEFEKRTKALLEMIIEDLQDTSVRLNRLETVAERLTDPLVVSFGLNAIYAAGRSYGEDKLRHLSTCVARVVSGDMPWSADADLALVLLRLVDELTIGQIQILEFLASPTKWESKYSRTLELEADPRTGRFQAHRAIAAAFPELQKSAASLTAMVAGLESRGLLNVIGFNDPEASFATREELYDGCASQLGAELLRFINLAD